MKSNRHNRLGIFFTGSKNVADGFFFKDSYSIYASYFWDGVQQKNEKDYINLWPRAP